MPLAPAGAMAQNASAMPVVASEHIFSGSPCTPALAGAFFWLTPEGVPAWEIPIMLSHEFPAPLGADPAGAGVTGGVPQAASPAALAAARAALRNARRLGRD